MGRKPKETPAALKKSPDFSKAIIKKDKITNTLRENYMPYAMSVIVSRAIPEIDGFKPAHRKLLYTMYKMGLLTGTRTKSANIVGQTMKLNPHGDGAIYETMVRLTRGNEALLLPLVDSKGNFGKQYSRDMAYAASRYTEAKLAPICSEIFKSIDKNTVDFVDNYDNTQKEPSLLPTSFPNILVNPNQGIAVGMASSICSFNLAEICDITIDILKNKEVDLTGLLPDFPTGGEILYSEKEIASVYETGRGPIKVRAKYTYDKKNNCIEITEIPYTTTVEAIIEKIIELVKTNKVKEIADIRDETGMSGFKLTIDVKKGYDPHLLMQKLFKLTPLQDNFSCNFNILIDGYPVVLGLKQILEEWIKFRTGCVVRGLAFDLDKKSKQLHLLKGLEALLLNIDKAIKIIKDSETDELVIANLMKAFKIDELQANFIADIKLRNLNKNYIIQKTAEIESLVKEIENIRDIMADEKKVKKLIITELETVKKKFGEPRKTTSVHVDEVSEIEEEDLIPDYRTRVFLTYSGYLKKVPMTSLRVEAEQKLKNEGDFILQELDSSNRAELLFFSSKGNVYKLKAHEIPDGKPSLLGEYLTNLLSLEEDEKIQFFCSTKDYKGELIFCFENGKMVRLSLSLYQTKNNRKRLINALYIGSRMVGAFHVTEDRVIITTLLSGKKIKTKTADIPVKTTKASQGVQKVPLGKRGVIQLVELVPQEVKEEEGEEDSLEEA